MDERKRARDGRKSEKWVMIVQYVLHTSSTDIHYYFIDYLFTGSNVEEE